MKDRWRVIYGFMEKHNWLDETLPQSFPLFSEARHSVLCSELKQLYVAITRTRQRLWICENKEELSKPMFDYWKVRGLVQVRQLDDSVAQAMRVESSPQEWRERGKKVNFSPITALVFLCLVVGHLSYFYMVCSFSMRIVLRWQHSVLKELETQCGRNWPRLLV